jgi:hypothetical protein
MSAEAPMVAVSSGKVEEMFKAACMLQIALRGLMAEASEEGGCNLDRDDFYPFWELSLELVRDLRLLHHEGRA